MSDSGGITLREKLRKWGFLRACYQPFFVAPYRWRQFVARFFTRRNDTTVLFYPDLPTRHHVLFKVCCVMGYRMTNDPKVPTRAVVSWQDETWRKDDEALRAMAARRKVLNFGATDISKRAVERVVKETFGYGTFVDPTKHIGVMVEKSDANAQHDGRTITGPIATSEVKPEKIYQLLVDNRISDSVVQDVRVGFHGDDLCYCILKRYSIHRRFADKSISSEVSDVFKVFSADEIEKIRASCRAIGLDTGALDLARDRNSGLLYLLDMNATPTGPVVLRGAVKWRALERMGEAFERQILLSREGHEGLRRGLAPNRNSAL